MFTVKKIVRAVEHVSTANKTKSSIIGLQQSSATVANSLTYCQPGWLTLAGVAHLGGVGVGILRRGDEGARLIGNGVAHFGGVGSPIGDDSLDDVLVGDGVASLGAAKITVEI